jgi:plastocyanin
MRLALRLALPTAIAALTFIACAAGSNAPSSSAPAAGGAGAAVAIKGFAYSPAALTVAKGTTVTFTNNDSATHTISSGANRTKDGKFDQQVAGSAEATITFDTPGTFEYFCQFHSSMKGTITVK